MIKEAFKKLTKEGKIERDGYTVSCILEGGFENIVSA